MSKLTEDERAILRDNVAHQWSDPAVAVTIARAVTPAVEAILTAQLARFEALADEWERQLGEVAYVTELRAALAAAPSREGES